MRAEHKRLEDVAEAEWREMKTALASLSERTSALDVLTTQIDDLCSDAQQCSSQWMHEKMLVNASVMQIRELSAALGSDSNGRGGGAGRGGRMKNCRTPPTDRGHHGGRAGGGRKAGVSARRTMNAALEGSMQVLPGDHGKPGGGGGGGGGGEAFERASLLDKVHQLQEIRREHESRLSALREEQRHAEAAVEQSAKFVGDVLALGREERQVCLSSCACALCTHVRVCICACMSVRVCVCVRACVRVRVRSPRARERERECACMREDHQVASPLVPTSSPRMPAGLVGVHPPL